MSSPCCRILHYQCAPTTHILPRRISEDPRHEQDWRGLGWMELLVSVVLVLLVHPCSPHLLTHQLSR